MSKFNLHTKIINALGRHGPLTRAQLIAIVGSESVTTRIYEINKNYPGLRIEKDRHGGRYYLKLVRNIKIDHKKVYPEYHARKAA